jgi:hypothetical protein
MRKKHTDCYLSNVSTFPSHVWTCDYLEIRLVSRHSAIIVNTSSWIKYMNKWMLALYQIDLLLTFWTN